MAVPRNRPLHFAIVSYYLLRVIAPGGATAAGAGALHAVAQKER